MLQRTHQARLPVEQDGRPRLGEGQPKRLQVVVLQDERLDLVGQRSEEGRAVHLGDAARLHQPANADLDVDLVIGGVDAGRIVDRVGVEPATVERIFDPGALRHSKVRAFADDLRPQCVGVDTQAVVGTVACIAVTLEGGLHIGADAAEPEQIDVLAQQRLDQFLRASGVAEASPSRCCASGDTVIDLALRS